jgi:HlyD family secretion protein
MSEMNTIKKHKWIWIIGGLVLVIGLVALISTRTDSTATAEADMGETAVAFIGDLSESATASGQVVAQREAGLSLATSGVVDQINIAVGDEVKAGDALIQLDQAALERSVAAAERDVIIAEAEQANLLAGATDADIFAAEAAVSSAQARLDDSLDGPSAEQITASEATVKAAQANMWSGSGQVQAANDVSEADILAAEANLNAALEQQEAAHNAWILLADCSVNDSGVHECLPKDNSQSETATQNVQTANAQVAIAEARLAELRDPDANNVASSSAGLAGSSAQYDAAVARHEALLLGASESDIAAAEAELASAQATLATLLAGPSESSITIYETRLAQAKTGLQEASNTLADATLTAPFDGIITAVNVSEGELASGLVATIVDGDSLEVVLNVDEIDVGSLALDQPAVVTMETWPEVEIDSFVSVIAPVASTSGNGIVSYEVNLSLQESDLPILVGMTANADLVTANREDVLLVPNAAITADRENGTFTVNLVRIEADGTRTTVPVEVAVGLKDKNYTQIIDGLVEGDVVLVGTFEAPTQSFGFGPGG